MGAFISIKSDTPCPNCHKPMEWQSKRLTYDGLHLNVAQTVPLTDRAEGEMHGLCDACGKWFDVDIKKGQPVKVKQTEPLKRI